MLPEHDSWENEGGAVIDMVVDDDGAVEEFDFDVGGEG